MMNICTRWKDQLLEAALAETVPGELRDHLAQCPDCAAELQALQARRSRMDALLSRLARAVEPSPGLHARILSAVESPAARRRFSFTPRWALAVALAVVVIAATIGVDRNRSIAAQQAELRGAQALAQWHAPTDVLLQTPGHEFLTDMPRLGESYITIPIEMNQGGNQ